MNPSRKVLAAAMALTVSALVITVPAGPASASGGCGGARLRINLPAGGEPWSWAYGHRHATGNHYIRAVVPVGAGRVVSWYADNSGGRDGDTRDTHHTDTYCT